MVEQDEAVDYQQSMYVNREEDEDGDEIED